MKPVPGSWPLCALALLTACGKDPSPAKNEDDSASSGAASSGGSSSTDASGGADSSTSGGNASDMTNAGAGGDGPSNTTEPTAVELSQQMGVGWNLGNSLEAVGPGNETAWGNPVITQTLIDAVKAAGFDTIRIPVGWSVFSDADSFTIDPSWLTRVAEVVTYALNADLRIVLNEHWDGGWLDHPTYDRQDELNERLSTMWTQIATHFQDYDHRLLFAGTNEVRFEQTFDTPTEEYYTVQNSFNQTFVDAVRATGGNNADRYLVVQAFNTGIDYAVDFTVIPTDTVADRLFLEVHYYDPYNFTLNAASDVTEWPSTTETWANEPWVDGQMAKMKSNFVDQGVAVIVGEYAVSSRESVPGFEASRVAWNQYVTQSAVDHGLVPIYWDAGATGDGTSGLFDRASGDPVYPDIIEAIVGALE